MKNTTSMPSRDWEAIEREYRAGQLSVSEIGRQNAVSHTAINKRAKKEGWARDLTEKVRATVSARLVSDEVSATNAKEAVELAAARGVQLVRQHRGSLSKSNKIVEKLLAELDTGTDDNEAIEAAVIDDTKGDKTGERRTRMLRAVSLPVRASVARELSQTLKNLIPLERQAFSLDETGGRQARPAENIDPNMTAKQAADAYAATLADEE